MSQTFTKLQIVQNNLDSVADYIDYTSGHALSDFFVSNKKMEELYGIINYNLYNLMKNSNSLSVEDHSYSTAITELSSQLLEQLNAKYPEKNYTAEDIINYYNYVFDFETKQAELNSIDFDQEIITDENNQSEPLELTPRKNTKRSSNSPANTGEIIHAILNGDTDILNRIDNPIDWRIKEMEGDLYSVWFALEDSKWPDKPQVPTATGFENDYDSLMKSIKKAKSCKSGKGSIHNYPTALGKLRSSGIREHDNRVSFGVIYNGDVECAVCRKIFGLAGQVCNFIKEWYVTGEGIAYYGFNYTQTNVKTITSSSVRSKCSDLILAVAGLTTVNGVNGHDTWHHSDPTGEDPDPDPEHEEDIVIEFEDWASSTYPDPYPEDPHDHDTTLNDKDLEIVGWSLKEGSATIDLPQPHTQADYDALIASTTDRPIHLYAVYGYRDEDEE